MKYSKLRVAAIFSAISISQTICSFSAQAQVTEVSKEIQNLPSENTVNISIHPLEMLLGYASASAEFGISKSVTVGPYVSYWGIGSSYDQNSSSYQTLTLGAISTISLGHPKFTSGVFFQPFVQYSTKMTTSYFSAGVLGIGGNFGYGWFWDSGLNLLLGAGLKYGQVEASLFGHSAWGAVLLPSATVQLGYSF